MNWLSKKSNLEISKFSCWALRPVHTSNQKRHGHSLINTVLLSFCVVGFKMKLIIRSTFIAGVLRAWFVQPLMNPDYYSNITENTDNKWKAAHGGKNVQETIKEYLVTYLGEPLEQMLRYSIIILKEHNMRCILISSNLVRTISFYEFFFFFLMLFELDCDFLLRSEFHSLWNWVFITGVH